MKKIYQKENSRRLTAYSAMAVAVIAGSKTAQAEIVYVDVEDTNIEVGGTFDIDLDGDGTMDFHFRASSTVSSTSSGVWSFGSIFGNATSYSVGNASNQVIGYVGAYYNYGSALASGVDIGPDASWLNYPSYGNSAVLASNFYGVTYGAFPGAGEKFLGIKFKNADGLHYGWMRITADIDPVIITIMDYAYENNTDVAIASGQTLSINIQQLPEGAVNIYSYNSLVNLINTTGVENAIVTIYSVNGDEVFSAPFTENSMQVDLSAYATGNYVVNVKAEAGQLTKQVFIN